MIRKTHSAGRVSAIVVAVGLCCFCSAVSAEAEKPAHPGVIRGIVVDAETGKAIEGAYVGVGDFGDSGGSNRSRHRSQGLFAKSETDAQGKFELDGLVFTRGHKYLKSHPLVVTHDDYVRADVKVELSADKPQTDVNVKLRKAARIDVTMVDSRGQALDGYWLLRLEDLSGRRFIPPGKDPHLSTFASSVWTKNPDMRKNRGRSTGFSFTALDSGQYRIEAIRIKMLPDPSPEAIWEMPWRYYGSVDAVAIETGETKAVRIGPKDYDTSLTIKTPAKPFEGLRKLNKKPEDFLKGERIVGFLSISRNPQLRVWDMGRVYHVEDHRLGRIQKGAMFYTMAGLGENFTIENLPPGRYAVFSMAYVKVVIALSSATIDVVPGWDIEIELPAPIIEGVGQVGTYTLNRTVRLTKSKYSIKQLCEIVSARTESSPQLVADSEIANEEVRLDSGQIVIWELLEKICAQKGLRLRETEKNELNIVPAGSNDRS